MSETKIHENRVRRIAKRQLFTLAKSRRRDTHAFGYGLYWLVDEYGNHSMGGSSLAEIEQYLLNDKAEAERAAAE